MTEFPTGWAPAQLGEVAEWSSGGTPRAGTPAYYGGNVPWAVIGDLNDGRVSETASTITPLGLKNSSAKIVDAGAVLVAMYGSIGKLGIAQIPMATNQAIACAVPSRAITRDWLFWWLRSQRHELLAAGKGGTQSNISQTVLKAWPIPLAPRAEQERIVTAIEEAFSKLDTGEAGLRTVRQLLKRMRDAILTAAVTGRLVPQDPTDTPAAKLLADRGVQPTEGADLPNGWTRARAVDLLAEPLANGRSVRSQAGGFSVLRLTCLRDGTVDRRETKEGEWTPEAAAPYLIRRGDFLVSRGNGSLALVGRGGLVVDDDPPVAYPDTLIRMRLAPATLEAKLLVIWWNSAVVRRQLEGEARTTAGIYKVNQSMIESVVLPIPAWEEQARLVSEVERQLSFVTACERAVDVGLARSAGLRRSVLKAAFEGRLVPQDSSDEPASVLLDRIRAERPAKPIAKRRTRKSA